MHWNHSPELPLWNPAQLAWDRGSLSRYARGTWRLSYMPASRAASTHSVLALQYIVIRHTPFLCCYAGLRGLFRHVCVSSKKHPGLYNLRNKLRKPTTFDQAIERANTNSLRGCIDLGNSYFAIEAHEMSEQFAFATGKHTSKAETHRTQLFSQEITPERSFQTSPDSACYSPSFARNCTEPYSARTNTPFCTNREIHCLAVFSSHILYCVGTVSYSALRALASSRT